MNDLVKRYWVVVVLVVAAFALGRYSLAPQTVTQIQYETVHDVQVKAAVLTVFKERTVTTQVDRVVVTVTSPDGTVTKTETDKSHVVDHSTEASQEKKVEVVEHVEEKLDLKQTVVENRPDWHITGTVGLTPLLKAEPMTYGLTVERRVFGPFFLGATLNTKLDGGLTLGMEW